TRVEASQWRKSTTLILRTIAVLCFVLALAGLHRNHREEVLAVAFLLDVSESVPTDEQQRGIDLINATIDEMEPTDVYSVVLFAVQSTASTPVRSKMEQPNFTPDMLSEAALDYNATDIAAALHLAMRILPDDRQKRIVMLSDGLQNAGDSNPLLDLAQASGIEIFTIPLNSERADEVWVRDLHLPSNVISGQTFTVSAIVESTDTQPVEIHLHRDGKPVSDSQSITLKPGKQEIRILDQLINEPGSYTYQFKISVRDGILENNEAYGYVSVRGQPRALYVEDDAGQTDVLKHTLESSGFAVDVVSPHEFTTELADLRSNAVVILSNVSADDFSNAQMELIESYVCDLGKGLVVIGGEHAFGMGGYHGTALERVLPVDMTPKQRKESLALMFVIDTSGSMANYVGADQKIQLAIEGIRAGVRELDKEDKAGVIGFAAKIGLDISPTTDHGRIIREVGGLAPTGGTKMYPALKRAYEKLKVVDAKQKHLILLSDGRSDGDFDTLAERIAADDIYVTTIAIGDAAQNLMQAIAERGQGNYVPVHNVNQLPRILADEVRQTQKYMVQETFQPIISEKGSAIMAGIVRLPRLHGYIATSEKEYSQVYIRSHQEHPILTAWHYGFGKSVAFTSDVKPGWAAEWIEWEQFGKFWGQVVNWAAPAHEGSGDFDLDVSHRGGVGQVVIDIANAGTVTSNQRFDVRVAPPNGAGKIVEMHRQTPTRFIGEFTIGETGVYLVTAQMERDGRVSGTRRANLALSYPAEYSEFETNLRLLGSLARRTNGIFEPTPKQIAKHTGTAVETPQSLSHLLLMAGILMFVLEMILRRFSVASGYVTQLREQVAAFRRSEKGESTGTMSRLSARKAELAGISKSAQISRKVDLAKMVLARENNASAAIQGEGNMGRLLRAKRRAQGG
ncbi:MAG: VWA domain-containing protein, partial [Candidatus Poribacteria bacterium]|nr:VWA domain-containing protein [Candidatus Poribacteria bacterium]